MSLETFAMLADSQSFYLKPSGNRLGCCLEYSQKLFGEELPLSRTPLVGPYIRTPRSRLRPSLSRKPPSCWQALRTYLRGFSGPSIMLSVGKRVTKSMCPVLCESACSGHRGAAGSHKFSHTLQCSQNVRARHAQTHLSLV